MLKYDNTQHWRRDVADLFDFLDTHSVIETHAKCGTHVYISLLSGEWLTDDLKQVASTILWLETAFEVLVPDSRRGNICCKSNRLDNPKFLEKTPAQCMVLIDECENNVAVADLMNNEGDRYYAQNFKNLYYGGKKTIEFRRGPGVDIEQNATAWV